MTNAAVAVKSPIENYTAVGNGCAVKKKTNFTQISNAIIHDTTLSVGARLTLIHMLSKPAGWQFYTKVIAREIGVNESTAKKYVRELISAGYVVREEKRENGRLAGYIYRVYETPVHAGEGASLVVPTDGEKTDVGKITPINTQSINTDKNKKQEDDIYNTHEKNSVKSEQNAPQTIPGTDEETITDSFDWFQEEIYEQAQKYGFPVDTARLFALRCEGLEVKATTIDRAFTALMERMNDRTQPRIVSLPAYFRVTLEDEMSRQQAVSIQREKERQERERKQQEAAAFVPYNWLEESDEVTDGESVETYDDLIKRSPLYGSLI